MHRAIRMVSITLVGMVLLTGPAHAVSADDRSEILKVRESVWRDVLRFSASGRWQLFGASIWSKRK
jgi:hypothetical protein